MTTEMLVILWLLPASIAAVIAYKKGQSAAAFFLAGAVFSVFGILWAWAMPTKPKEPKPEIDWYAVPSKDA